MAADFYQAGQGDFVDGSSGNIDSFAPLHSSATASFYSSSTVSEDDDLYGLGDVESQEVPLKYTGSIHKQSKYQQSARYPSLIIPSPSAWPTIQKLMGGHSPSVTHTPISCLPISPAILNKISAMSMRPPARSATPSLDGSLTSEELAGVTCPSTPDIDDQDEELDEWKPFLKLHPEALETLHQLAASDLPPVAQQVTEIPEHQEMQEMPRIGCFDVGIDMIRNQFAEDDCEPLSALSIPSPGGFFSSLAGSAKCVWTSPSVNEEPSTTVAEQFYELPWASSISHPESSLHNQQPSTVGPDGRPNCSRQSSYDSDATLVEVTEIGAEKLEYKDNYQEELRQLGNANMDRTTLWLADQSGHESSGSGAQSPGHILEQISPNLLRDVFDNESTASPMKKAVRFADEVEQDRPKVQKPENCTDSTFYRAFQGMQKSSSKQDAFVHQHTRVEAINLWKKCFPDAHKDHLKGVYQVRPRLQGSGSRPVSNFFPDVNSGNDKTAEAAKCQQSVEQLQYSCWSLQAIKFLNGGKLFNSPVIKELADSSRKARVLDLGGEITCSWAWQAAIDCPKATIYTVTDQLITSKLRGPSNHRVVTVPNLWTLPFPDNSFDVISARTLFVLLNVDRASGESKQDQYDLCLRECHRCLKPSGYLEYNLLDAELVHAGQNGLALSVELGFNLRTRGYDPNPTRSFLPRLAKAGFDEIKRAWMILPVARNSPSSNLDDGLSASSEAVAEKAVSPEGNVMLVETPKTGSTAAASGISGMVGARMWEKWILKLHVEMGRDEGRLLEGVAATLEEGGKVGAGWRCLTGWARKAL